MKKRVRSFSALFVSLALCLSLLPGVTLPAAAATDPDAGSKFVVLTTTDMHGKVWNRNVLTGDSVNNSFLQVASKVKEIRDTYGEDRVITIDNGDLYQGTPVSSYHITNLALALSGKTADAAFARTAGADAGKFNDVTPMALALKYIGYDACVLGNHEFNYGWASTQSIYRYLESRDALTDPWTGDAVTGLTAGDQDVPVLAANLYWDGTDGTHTRGDNVFKPYTTKTLTVAGKSFKVGILGLENTDCTRWDVGDNYPGISFADPDGNPRRDMALEADKYVKELKTREGCDFIIVAYHSGLGSYTAGDTLTFGQNTENQISRILAKVSDIDMIVAGHDHSTGYSNNTYKDKDNKDVLVVNGGGSTLTESVFTATVDAQGKLVINRDYNDTAVTGCSVSQNLSFDRNSAADAALASLIKPYADAAEGYVKKTVGTLTGTWDKVGSSACYLERSDTMDLINRAQIAAGNRYLPQKYAAPTAADPNLDHLTVDLSCSSVVFANASGYAKAGPITLKDIYMFYKYDNSLYLVPMTGTQIKDVLEFNASERLSAAVKNGKVQYKTIGDSFTNPVFYGLDFEYDMSRDPLDRVVIKQWSDGRTFDPAKTYVVAVNNYHLGNGPFAAYSTSDAIWSQTDDLGGGTVQDLIAELIEDAGASGLAPAPSSWALTWSAPVEADPLYDFMAYVSVDLPAAGDEVYLYDTTNEQVLGVDSKGVPKGGNAKVEKGVLTTSMGAWSVGKDGTHYTFANGGKYLAADAKGTLSMETPLSDAGRWSVTSANDTLTLKNAATGAVLMYGRDDFAAVNMVAPGGGPGGPGAGGPPPQGGPGGPGGRNAGLALYTKVNAGKLLKNTPRAGEKFVLHIDGNNMSRDANSAGTKLKSVKAEPQSGLLPVPEKTAVMTLEEVAGKSGTYAIRKDAKFLTYPASGNGLTWEDSLTDLGEWKIEKAQDGYNLLAAGAAYNGNHNQYMEVYNGSFTTYGGPGGSAFLVNFYAFDETKGFTPPAPEVSEVSADTYVLPLFESSDVHGYLVDTSSGVAESYQYRGAYLAKLIDEKRQGSRDGVILLDGGDIYQANVVSNLQNGKPLVAAYDLMGYDGVCLGNHEFDWGVTTVCDSDGTMGSYRDLQNRETDSQIPVLACNVFDKATGKRVDFTRDYVILDKKAANAKGESIDVKVAVIGYVPDYSTDIMAARIEPYELRQDFSLAENIARSLKADKKADACILLSHDGAGSAAAHLQNGTAFDLVLGGHTHSYAMGVNKGITYLQASTQNKDVAYTELCFDRQNGANKVFTAGTKKIALPTSGDEMTEANSQNLQADVYAVSRRAVDAVADVLSSKLGYIETSVNKSIRINGQSKSTMGANWITDLQNRGTGTSVSFTNSGGIRTSLDIPQDAETRDVTEGDVYTIAPFCNNTYVYEVTYAELKDLLEESIGEDAYMSGITCYYTDGTVRTLIEDADHQDKVIYDNGTWTDDWAARKVRLSANSYLATSTSALMKAWNKTDKLLDSTSYIDNETFIQVLKDNYKITGGLIYVDPNAYMIDGTYTPHTHTYEESVKAGSSGRTGYTLYTCSVCGKSYIDSIVKANQSHAGSGGTPGASGSIDFTVDETVKKEEEGKVPETEPFIEFTTPQGDEVKAFTDIPEDHWATEGINFALANHIMNGMGAGRFEPERTATRAMFVTMLYRMVGEPTPEEETDGNISYSDVDGESWYGAAVGWASTRSIVNGMGTRDGVPYFSPDGQITREQLVAMLYRYAGTPAVPNLLLTFDDADKISPWAEDAIRWAVDNKLLEGRGHNLLFPDGNATRAEVATLLMRFVSIQK